MVPVGSRGVKWRPAVAVGLVNVGPVDVEEADQDQVVVHHGLKHGSKSVKTISRRLLTISTLQLWRLRVRNVCKFKCPHEYTRK